MFNSYDDFKNTAIAVGGFDVDSAYGKQCWDLPAKLWLDNCGRSLITKAGGGVARECWEISRDINAGSEFDLITDINNVKRGDVVVLSMGNEYGHIAFADEDYLLGSNLRLFGQNQRGNGGGNPPTLDSINMLTFLGAFRYKAWQIRAGYKKMLNPRHGAIYCTDNAKGAVKCVDENYTVKFIMSRGSGRNGDYLPMQTPRSGAKFKCTIGEETFCVNEKDELKLIYRGGADFIRKK